MDKCEKCNSPAINIFYEVYNHVEILEHLHFIFMCIVDGFNINCTLTFSCL